MIGTVRWFNLQKGYGFIHPDDGSPNIFVHMSAVESPGMSDLKEGRRVIFEIQRDERTGKESAVSLVFKMTPRLDGRFAITNPFDIISAFISSTFVDALAVVKGATRSRSRGSGRAGERPLELRGRATLGGESRSSRPPRRHDARARPGRKRTAIPIARSR